MGRVWRTLLIVLGAMLLVSVATAQQGTQDSENNDSGQNGQEQNGQQADDNQNEKRDYELLSLVEFEFLEIEPSMFTLYGEDFVDSINSLLKKQVVNSSVVGVMINEQTDEDAITVAVLILSYFNDTILSQLGDIETYIGSYLYKNQNDLSLQPARVTSVHSRKVTTLSSDSEKYHKGWVFVAGTSQGPIDSVESKSMGTVATVRYSKVEFTLGHGHSFGYGVGERSFTARAADAEEVAELDDDYIEWNRFKVFHIRDIDTVSEGTKGWKTMTWSESSLQKAAQDTWSNSGRRHIGAGATTGIVLGVMAVAAAVIGGVSYGVYRKRKRHLKQEETTSPERESTELTGGIDEETALV